MSDNIATPEQVAALNRLTYPPFREPSFEYAVTLAINLAKIVLLVVEECPRGPPGYLRQIFQAIADFTAPTEKLVGFIGDSGAGKSSTLNAVVNHRGLARVGALGTAVTAFAARYRFRVEKRHHAAFTLECKLMYKEQLGKYLGDLLRDFRGPVFSDPKEREESGAKLYEKSTIAKNVYEAAFGGLEFFSIEKLEHDDDEASRKAAIEHLEMCCQALEFPDDLSNDGTWIQEAEDAEECQEHQELLYDRGLWPFVEWLHVYLDIDVLSRGLTLVDLPGFNDANLARMRVARKAQQACDDLLLVVDIARATDTAMIQQSLEFINAKAEAEKATAVNVTIICTRSALGLLDDKRIERHVDRVKLKQAKDEFKAAERVDPNGRAKELAKQRLEKLLMLGRNAKITKDLLRKYGSYVKNGVLKVFCIDNQMYWEAKREEEKELSGIPSLRETLQDFPAESLFKDTNLFLSKNVPAGISSLETWVASCRVDHELEKQQRLPEASDLRMTLDAIEEWKDAMHAAFRRCIDEPLERESDTICSACLGVAKKWQDWPAASVGSWVRNDGTWKSGAKGARCWNKELLDCFNDAVTGQAWHDFAVETHPGLTTLDTAVSGLFNSYAQACTKLQAPANFQKSLNARRDIAKNAISDAQKTWSKKTGQIRLLASSTHQESYIVDCMLETYREASRGSGSGVTKGRHKKLQDRVSSDEFVADFRALIFEDFRAALNDVAGRLKATIEPVVKAIEGDLETIQPSKGNEKLFKVDPNYGMKCEEVLSKAERMMEEIDDLAKTARAMANEQYT